MNIREATSEEKYHFCEIHKVLLDWHFFRFLLPCLAVSRTKFHRRYKFGGVRLNVTNTNGDCNFAFTAHDEYKKNLKNWDL